MANSDRGTEEINAQLDEVADSEIDSGESVEEINAQFEGLGVEDNSRPIVETITAEFDMEELERADVYHYSDDKRIGDFIWKIIVKRNTQTNSLRVGLRFLKRCQFEGRLVTQCFCYAEIHLVRAEGENKTIEIPKSYFASGKEHGKDIIKLSELDDTNAGFQHNGKLKIEVNLMIYGLTIKL